MAPAPSAKFFETGDRLYVQAQRIWLILVAFVKESPEGPGRPRPKLITYGDLAMRMGAADGRAGHTLGRQLGIIGAFCLANKLPALNAIVVNGQTLQPGAEVVLTPDRTVVQEQVAVSNYDWYTVRVPTTGTFRQVWDEIRAPD